MTKLYCIACPNGCLMTVLGTGAAMAVEGNKCPKGFEFAKDEITHPTRTLTTTVRTSFSDVPVISVRTDGEIPKDLITKAMVELSEVVVSEELAVGDVVVENVADSEINVIITSPALMKRGAEMENKNVQLPQSSPSDNQDYTSEAIHSGTNTGTDTDSGTVSFDSDGYPVNEGVLDAIGEDAIGGFVGAAGEAVGVDDGESGDDSGADGTGSGKDGKDSKEKHSRARINRP